MSCKYLATGDYECQPNVTSESFQNTKINVKETFNNDDACADWAVNGGAIPKECYAQKWSEKCTVPPYDNNISWAQDKTPEDIAGHLNIWATSKDPIFRDGCYGACTTYNETGKNISDACYKEKWSKRCTQPYSPANVEWAQDKTPEEIASHLNTWATSQEPVFREGCHGTK